MFFFKQKTAYEMRISDWSSDVCSSDLLWRGRAIELAGHDAIAVYPVGGWWKSHVGQKRVADKARYALVISISAPGQDVDLYSEINTLVENKEIEVLLG